MDDLPTDYDAIVVGTGMTESVIAAAISRIGKNVLHIDSNDYYGENWASFSLEGFQNWLNSIKKVDACKQNLNESSVHLLNENESFCDITKHTNIWNVTLNEYSEAFENEEKKDDIIKKEESNSEIDKEVKKEEASYEMLQKNMQKLSKSFNLDLCPKLLFSKGKLVQLLISSNIARYTEFKSVSRVLTWRNNQLEPVPCSRADVFATKNVTVVQKRILVKILTLFANYSESLDEFEGFENKTFLEYLKHKKLPDNLIHYILYAIAMGDNLTGCLEGVRACKAFLESLGRYGNTPFIFSMYGSGELPQCFCRLCAVYGGIYCLQKSVESLVIKEQGCVAVISDKKRLNTKTVILSSNHAPKHYLVTENTESISRGIFITDRSILHTEKESLTLLQFPPIPDLLENSVTVIELGSGTCTCPKNYFVVHMTTKMTKEASLDLKHVIESLFETKGGQNNKKDSKPRILWSLTWNASKGSSRPSEHCPKNVKICCGVDSELDYNFSVTEAERIFKEIFPEEEFLPRAPDPEEIISDSEEKSIAGDAHVQNLNQTYDTTTNNQVNKSEHSNEE